MSTGLQRKICLKTAFDWLIRPPQWDSSRELQQFGLFNRRVNYCLLSICAKVIKRTDHYFGPLDEKAIHRRVIQIITI